MYNLNQNQFQNALVLDHVRVNAPVELQHDCHEQIQGLNNLEIDTSEYLFVRTITINTDLNSLKNKIEKTLEYESMSAISGDLPAAETASAVRFNNLGQLLAQLSLAIISGKRHIWFWKNWQYLFEIPIEDALSILWSEYVIELPDVVHSLYQTKRLHKILAFFNQHHAKQITNAIVNKLGIHSGSLNLKHHTSVTRNKVQLSEQCFVIWRDVIRQTTLYDEHVYLMAILILLANRADVFVRPDVNKIINDVVNDIWSKAAPKQTSQTIGKSTDDTFKDSNESSRNDCSTVINDNKLANTKILSDKKTDQAIYEIQNKASRSDSSNSTTESKDDIKNLFKQNIDQRLSDVHYINQSKINIQNDRVSDNRQEKNQEKTDSNTQVSNQNKESHTSSDSQESKHLIVNDVREIEIFDGAPYCQQGGIFYLLNFMARSKTQSLLEQHNNYDRLNGGWGCLYRLSDLLGRSDDAGLERFLCYQIGLDDIDALHNIPLLNKSSSYQNYAEKLYGKKVWNNKLLDIPAQIQFTKSHLDVHFPLEKISIEVRQSGLDLNPGWLPWLGKVVNFHYHSDFIFG